MHRNTDSCFYIKPPRLLQQSAIPNAIFTNYREFKMLMRDWLSRRADFATSHLCSSHYTGCLNYSLCKSLATLGDRSFMWPPLNYGTTSHLCITLRKQLRPFYLRRLFKSTFYFLHTLYVYIFLLLVNRKFLFFL